MSPGPSTVLAPFTTLRIGGPAGGLLVADGVIVTIQAGEPWDGVVAQAAADGLSGIECLSGIPGSAGATPIQNVGAYGQEIADTLAIVRRGCGRCSASPANGSCWRTWTPPGPPASG